jgi:RNA polymerase sigma-70 factor, ECF subfamily
VLEGIAEPVRGTTPPMFNAPAAFDATVPQSFDGLFLALYPRLVSVLRRMLGDPGRAEELANEAFLKLHSSVLPPVAKKNVAGWVYRTAMNLGIDDLRARARRQRWEQQASRSTSVASHADDGLQLLLCAEKQKRVRTVLAKLKPEWAEVLLLRATGHSYREIASHLEIANNSVGTMLLRAEAAFEKCYLETFGEKD